MTILHGKDGSRWYHDTSSGRCIKLGSNKAEDEPVVKSTPKLKKPRQRLRERAGEGFLF